MIELNEKTITLILLLVLYIGCKTTKEINKDQILGKYQWAGTYGIGADITLLKDDRFTYNWQQGLAGGTTYGRWHLQGNNLILNSQRQPKEKNKKFEINSFKVSNTGEYKIYIRDKENYSLLFAECILMKDSTIIKGTETDENGICKLDMASQADKLQFSYIGHKTVDIPISKLEGNEFSLTLYEEDEFYEYFTNRKWVIDNGKIIDPKIEIDEHVKTNYYEKIKN